MARRRDDDFEARIAPPRGHSVRGAERLTSRVLRALAKARGPRRQFFDSRLSSQKGTGAARARGHVPARLLQDSVTPRGRRVVIKTRLVLLRQAGAHSISTHLRYIEREGVARDGTPGRAYGPDTDDADLTAFEARGRNDRHQFRLIVAPEDAVALDDLTGFTRDLMRRVEVDLATRLEWVAVDHWDTDNPHTHIVLRGKDESGNDLVIARDYISQGMRQRAGVLATSWLGPRSEAEIEAALTHQVGEARWTDLDRRLQRLAQQNVIELGRLTDPQRHRLIGRLQRLEELGLSQRTAPGAWRLRSDFEPTLRSLGERNDIIRAMQRALGQRQEVVVHDTAAPTIEVVGRVVRTVTVNELTERTVLLVDGTDGRAHAVPLSASVNGDAYAPGAIVRVGMGPSSRADRSIALLARDGIYRAVSETEGPGNPGQAARMHVRRLEALRRAGIVERVAEGVWRVPPDLIDRGRRYDGARAGRLEVVAQVPIERQVRAIAATWLDEQSQNNSIAVAPVGFGAEVQAAIRQRAQFLIDAGHAQRDVSGRLFITPAALARLRSLDLQRAGARLSREHGLTFRATTADTSIRGHYRRAIWLASGRYAMLERAQGFCLVPWRPVLEGRLGQSVSVTMRGERPDWTFGREQSLGR